MIFIYVRLANPESLGFFRFFASNTFTWTEWLMIVGCVAMVPLNWFIESYKWQRLIRDVEALSQWDSFKATLSGIAVGLFTINRVGEFGGRVMFVQPENRISAVMRTIMGSFSQLLITLIFGSISFAFLGSDVLQLPKPLYQSMMICAVAGSGLLLFIYYQYEAFRNFFHKNFIYRWMLKWGFREMHLNKQELNRALGLSFLRYAVFNIQFVLMVMSFGCPITWYQGLLATTCIFFIQTTIPTVSFLELGIRGAGALLIFGWFGCGDIPVLAASFLIWFMNLILPALVGLFYFLRKVR